MTVLDIALRDALAGLISLVVLYSTCRKLHVCSESAASFPIFGTITLPRDRVHTKYL